MKTAPEIITDLSNPPHTPAIVTPPVDSVSPLAPAVAAGYGISVSSLAVPRVTGGATTAGVITQDRVEDVTESATTVTDYQLAVARTGSQSAAISYTSSNDAVATVSASGLVSYVAPGRVRIRVSHGLMIVDIALTMASPVTTAEQRVYQNGAAGSARAAAETAVDSLISGGTMAANGHIFTTQDHDSPSYTRNASCWAHGLTGMTGISPWNSTGANKRAGTAITPRHIVFAKHYQIGTGATVRFVAADNTVVTRTMTAKESITGTDLTIGLLDSDLPASIEPVKMLPASYEDRLPTGLAYVPTLCLDQEEKALVTDGGSTGEMTVFSVPTDADRLTFYEPKISGDSGNPAFLVIGGELALISTWWYGGAGSGPFVPQWRTEIEAAITSLGANGHSLTDIDLSGYTNFA